MPLIPSLREKLNALNNSFAALENHYLSEESSIEDLFVDSISFTKIVEELSKESGELKDILEIALQERSTFLDNLDSSLTETLGPLVSKKINIK